MIRCVKALLGRRDGVSATEFAIVGPVFLLLIFALIQFGTLMYANSGLRQAVEVGARYATTYPRPTTTQISNKILASGYGMKTSQRVAPVVRTSISDPTNCPRRNNLPVACITLAYNGRINLVFVRPRTVTLTYSRTAYLAPET